MVPNAYIKDEGQVFEPIYVPSEIYSFYMNFDKPITDPDFANFRLNLTRDGVLVSPNLGTLKKDMVTAYSYNIYCEFVFPQVLDGCYKFVIQDIVTDEIKCTSNCITVEAAAFNFNSAILHYRHKRNLFNFQYSNLPDFYNKFRLPLNKIDYQYEVERKQYRNISDKKLRNLYSYRDKYIKVESYYFDEQAHDAMSAVWEHNDITIDGTRYLAKDEYQVDVDQQRALAKGSITAYEQELVFTPVEPDLYIYVLSPDGVNLLTDGNNNLILI